MYTKDQNLLCDTIDEYIEYAMETIDEWLTDYKYDYIFEGVDNISTKDLTDPKLVKKLKTQVKAIKNWKKLLNTISKLSKVGAKVGVGASVVTGIGVKGVNAVPFSDINNATSMIGIDISPVQSEITTGVSQGHHTALIATLIAVSISVLSKLIRKIVMNKQFDQLPALSRELDTTIRDCEASLANAATPEDKQAIQANIDGLHQLKVMVDSELNNIANESYLLEMEI